MFQKHPELSELVELVITNEIRNRPNEKILAQHRNRLLQEELSESEKKKITAKMQKFKKSVKKLSRRQDRTLTKNLGAIINH